MATESYQAQLERVQAQLAKIEVGGQSYSLDGRSHERVRYEVLIEREKYLRVMAAREAGGGGIGLSRGSPR